MIMQFIKECLFPLLACLTFACLVSVGVVWLLHVINSVSRAADALERIADVLECDEDDEEEDEEGGTE